MSLGIIKKQIFQFLSSDMPEVMAIKGEWGVGKTYAWKKFLKEASSTKRISLERYSYVSLFGINSLDAFKYAIFENVVKREIIGTEANIETLRDNTASLLESSGRKHLGLFRGAPIFKSFAPAIEALSFLSLSNTLICIDDLERKGAGVEIKDILGLVSLLKEQKGCKVVLLLNEGQEGLGDYRKYREKVIDIEIAFAPDPLECSSIAYSSRTPNCSRLRELTASLGIRNIRILKKIERLMNLSLPLIQKFEPEVLDQVTHTLVLFTWSYFCSQSNEEVPDLDFLTSISFSRLGSDEEEVSVHHEKWYTTLQAYGYTAVDELDLSLANAVRSGYFIDNEFIQVANKKNQEIVASKSEGSYFDAWRLYHDSFDNNGEEVINTLYESFKKNCKYLTPRNLSSMISLFREMGEGEKASNIIEFYVECRKGEIELFNMKESNFFGDIRDKEIVDRFNEIYEQSIKMESPKQVLARISGSNGWSQSDEIILASTSVEEFYNLFRTEVGSHLSSFVATCLQFAQHGGATGRHREITRRATEALLKIASESKINEIRVRNYGVAVVGSES